MGIPLDSDWNDNCREVASKPREARGGAFAPADIPVIKRALQVYLIDCMRTEGYGDRDPHPDVAPIANLLHRLGRITPK